MKRMTKLFSFILAVVLLFNMGVIECFASAEDTQALAFEARGNLQEAKIKSVDLNREYLTKISSASKVSEVIENTCKAFIALGRASAVDSAYSPEKLTAAPTDRADTTVAYRLSEFDYYAELHKAKEKPILADNITFSNFTCTVGKQSATASIAESYEYFYNDGFDGYNCRNRVYTFDLICNDGVWEISGVTTSDPWETEKFDYAVIDVAAAVDSVLNPLMVELPEGDELDEIEGNSRSLLYWTYNTSWAVAYASEYFNKTNSLFGFTTDANCQNFASQCVWSGLREGYSGATSNTAYPAVSGSIVGTSAPYVWCRRESTSGLAYPLNWAWDNVSSFAELIRRSSSSSTIGPRGSTYYGHLRYTALGDVISWDAEGHPASGTLNHAMVVTGTTGTYGSRTKTNLKVAANTRATTSAYQTLDSYAPSTYVDSYFTTCHITGGYYPVAKNPS